MDRIIQFLIFFSILATVFGSMQWYLLRAYLRWLKKVATTTGFVRLRATGMYVLFLGNLLFLLRFPSIEMSWYQNPLYQYLIIYPGGVFFGVIILSFLFLVLIQSGTWLIQTGYKGYRFVTGSGVPAGSDNTSGSSGELSDLGIASVSSESVASSGPADPARSVSDTGAEEVAGSGNSQGLSLINRRQFLRTTGAAMITAPALLTAGAAAATSHDYRIIRKKLYFPELPSALNGFRVVQISDLHSGIYMTESQMRDIFQLSNEQYPDLVAITGDFVDNSITEIPPLFRALTELKAEYGIFGCLGNHDHYASVPSVSSALRQREVGLLTNHHHSLTINGETLTLMGVDDPVSGQSDADRLSRALQGIPEEGFRILLSHRPDVFDEAIIHNIHLTLAGHTHGGQIGFNVMGVPVYPIYLFQKYPKGLFENGNRKLYVNVGIGMVGVPVRTVRPELTVIELTNYPESEPNHQNHNSRFEA